MALQLEIVSPEKLLLSKAVRCTVLANEAIPVGELSRATAEQRLAEATAAFDSVDKMDVTAIDSAMDRIQSARAMVEAAG